MNFTPILLVDRRRGRMLHAIFRLDSPPARAQTSTGEIVITVVDPSEAVVPNAQVTLTGTETGNVVRRLATNHAGIANAPLLPPQTYDIVVAAAGFNNLVRNGIVLHVGEALSLRLDLQAGAVTQSVTVVGETPMLDEASGTLAQVIEPRQILQLPLNGRNYLELGRLTMGGPFARQPRSNVLHLRKLRHSERFPARRCAKPELSPRTR